MLGGWLTFFFFSFDTSIFFYPFLLLLILRPADGKSGIGY